jgi:hypothetical protein
MVPLQGVLLGTIQESSVYWQTNGKNTNNKDKLPSSKTPEGFANVADVLVAPTIL